jgi:hypothetical protein
MDGRREESRKEGREECMKERRKKGRQEGRRSRLFSYLQDIDMEGDAGHLCEGLEN